MDTLIAILNYLQIILIDGDTHNDWLTHLPTWIQPLVMQLGIILQSIITRQE